MLGIAKVDESIEAGDGFENNVTALAAVATVGATIFDEFFAAKRNGAGSACAGGNVDFCLIEKMHGAPLAR